MDLMQAMAQELLAKEAHKILKEQLKDPNSPMSKAISNYTSKLTQDDIAALLSSNHAPNGVDRGIDSFKKYGPSASEVIQTDVALPVAGDIAAGIGSALDIKNSMFANALKSMSNEERKKTPDNLQSLAPYVDAMSAGAAARGNIADTIGKLAANRMYTLADTIKRNNDKARLYAFNVNEQPNVGFNQAISKQSISGTKGSAGKN